ncbi:MAG: 50S ribosomal protein L33 [Candidatus Omnitrophica bacterium]|nr:50S ribosomal protein L33 [Candidatus Omnitrophota bacterium]
MRENINFQCTECKRINYTSTKDKKKKPDRIELKKYCRFCRLHTTHKEMKK